MLQPELGCKDRQKETFKDHSRPSTTELVNNLLVWIPKHGCTQVDPPYKTYINQLALDTGMQINILNNAMEDRNVWRQRVDMVNSPDPVSKKIFRKRTFYVFT